MKVPSPLARLTERLALLPGIGPRAARRLAFHILKCPPREAQELAHAIAEVREKLRNCSICGGVSEMDPCHICSDPERDRGTICVVEGPEDVFSIERTSHYKGTYHVLMGVISPMDGISPSDLRIDQLVERIKGNGIKEIIIALNPNLAGEATATYLCKLIKPLGVVVSRIAYGLPMGSDLDYADHVTLTRAMEGRQHL